MENFLKKLNRAKSELGLPQDRKHAIRGELVHFMETYGAPTSLWHVFARPVPVFATLTILLATVGTSFAAEGTLPGDLLYPIKVGWNEKVVTALSFSREAKADWETKLAGRRLEEAAKLENTGKIDDKATELQDRFEKHVSRVQEHVAAIQADGDAEKAAGIEARLEATLEAHHKELMLSKSQETGSDHSEIQPLEDKVGDEVENASKIIRKIKGSGISR